MWICWAVLGALLLSTEGLELYDSSGQPQSASFIPGNTGAGRELRSGIFWTGSRYNRRDSPRAMDIKPRNDRFFMGSRYGKRARPATSFHNPTAREDGSLAALLFRLSSTNENRLRERETPGGRILEKRDYGRSRDTPV